MKLSYYLKSRPESEPLQELDSYFSGSKEGMFGAQGEHWTGPRLDLSDPDYAASLERIRQNYLTDNLTESVLSTHVSAVVGHEIDWQLKPENTEASTALTDWYYRLRVQETLQDACRTMLWAVHDPGETSAILRYHIPPRALDENGRTREKKLGPILESAVRLHHPRPGSAWMIRDDDGETLAGCYSYSRVDPDTNERKDYLELVALDETFAIEEWDRQNGVQTKKGETVIQIRSGTNYDEIVSEIAYPLDGALTIFELSRPPLITESVISQQDGLNTQWTYLNRHASASAFLERVILNGMPPGRWMPAAEVQDSEGLPTRTTQEGVKEVYTRAPYRTGAGETNFTSGIPLPEGGYTNPSVVFREPSSGAPLLANIKAHREAIMELSSQSHRLISGDATASGVSRQQALQDFVQSLGPTVTQVKLAAAWMLKTALLLASHFEAKGSYLGVEVDVKVGVWASTPTSDEKRLTLELYKGGLLSQTDAMRQIGTEDVDAELPKIQQEAAERFKQAQETFQARQGGGEGGRESENTQGNAL